MLTSNQGGACEHELAVGLFGFVLTGLLTGFTSALFAAGGAPVIVFGLMWLCGYSIKETTGPSLVTLAAGAMVGFGLRFYLQSHDLQLYTVMLMLPFGIIGVIAGHILTKRWTCHGLQEAFSCFVVVIGLKMSGLTNFLPALSVSQSQGAIYLLCGTATLAGIGSRMLGTGGGLLTVPALLSVGLAPHQALLTSLGLNIPMMLLGAGLNLRSQPPQWREVRWLICGAIAGATIGAYISYTYVPDVLLQRLFGGLLMVSAVITVRTRIRCAIQRMRRRMGRRRSEEYGGTSCFRSGAATRTQNDWSGIRFTFVVGNYFLL